MATPNPAGEPRVESASTVARDHISTPSKPAVLLLVTALAIFAGEVGVMLVLPLFPPLPLGVEAVLDGLLLTLLAAPVLYVLLFRRMVLHIEQHHRAERALNELNANLEERVQKRTAEVESANRSLERANASLQREIQERTAVDERLQTTSAFLQRLIESAPCLMSVVDASSLQCRYVNGRVEDFLGYSPDEIALMGPALFDRIVAPAEVTSVVGLVRSVADSSEDEIVRGRCELRRKDGRLEDFRLGLVPLSRQRRDQADEVLLVAVPTTDSA